jgi:hypothetical protein
MNDISSSKSAMLLKKVIRKVSPALRDDLQLLDLVRHTVVPIAPSQPDPVSCVPQTLLGSKGIDFHDDEQLARVSAWTGERYQAFFRELRDDRTLRIDNSGLYQTPDAEIYAANDIFLPFDYPNVFDGGLATEQYLMSCMLAYSPRYHTVMSTHRMTREYLAQKRAAFGAKVGDPAAEHFFGCSYWFEVRG